MKKYIAYLITIIMAVSIISCGGTTNEEPEPSIGDQMYEKYKTIIDKLEGENYDGAIEEIQAMKPAPVVQEVKITTDNFYDYYDIVYRENNFERDSEGNITKIDKWDYLFSFRLKDEYTLDENEDNKIVIGVTGDYDLKKIEDVDFETGKITIGEEVFSEYKDEIIESAKGWTEEDSTLLSVTCEGSKEILCNNVPGVVLARWINGENRWEAYYDITPDDYEGYTFEPVDIQITRTEGTLHIVDK